MDAKLLFVLLIGIAYSSAVEPENTNAQPITTNGIIGTNGRPGEDEIIGTNGRPVGGPGRPGQPGGDRGNMTDFFDNGNMTGNYGGNYSIPEPEGNYSQGHGNYGQGNGGHGNYGQGNGGQGNYGQGNGGQGNYGQGNGGLPGDLRTDRPDEDEQMSCTDRLRRCEMGFDGYSWGRWYDCVESIKMNQWYDCTWAEQQVVTGTLDYIKNNMNMKDEWHTAGSQMVAASTAVLLTSLASYFLTK